MDSQVIQPLDLKVLEEEPRPGRHNDNKKGGLKRIFAGKIGHDKLAAVAGWCQSLAT